MKKIFRAGAYESFYDMPMIVSWGLSTKCNYRCSYCFNYGIGRQAPPQLPFSTLSQLRAAVDNIASLNRTWYDFIFAGSGEPTLHPHIFDLLVMLHETLGKRLNSIAIFSNGSRKQDLYRKISDISKTVNVNLMISIHTEYVDMVHILEIIESLSQTVSINFNLMFNPDKREEVHLIYDILFEYRKMFPFGLEIALIFDKTNHLDTRYTEEDFLWQEKAVKDFDTLVKSPNCPKSQKQESLSFHGFYDVESNGEREIIDGDNIYLSAETINDLAHFQNMYCISYASMLKITENGDCRGMMCADAPFVNIFEKDSFRAVRDKFIYGIKCPFEICKCPSNHIIPKFLDFQEALSFVKIMRKKQHKLFVEYDVAHAVQSAR